jgi:hypothetical protein
VLDARESLLFDGDDNFTIDDDCCSRVMIPAYRVAALARVVGQCEAAREPHYGHARMSLPMLVHTGAAMNFYTLALSRMGFRELMS